MGHSVTFQLEHLDPHTAGRAGLLSTPHGVVPTPAFMPVGTRASVKGLLPEQVRASGARMILGNTYHLAIRPGEQVIADLGGLHRFMGWDGPILTDSGGFQIFSLARLAKVTDRGAVFRSHVDGALLEITPERAVAIQEALGSDIAMVLDHVISLPNDRLALADAAERSVAWARRCRDAARRGDQSLFGIVQGGLEKDLRLDCAAQLIELDLAGYAVGGLSVGETPTEMAEVLDYTCPALPADRPRYLMGVGRPQDLLAAVVRGIDMFDCVMPTRNGRNALAFTAEGTLRLRNERHRTDDRPLEADCPCAACGFSRAYLRHLFQTDEMLGPVLLSLHNLTYYQRLLSGARRAIVAGTLGDFVRQTEAGWAGAEPASSP